MDFGLREPAKASTPDRVSFRSVGDFIQQIPESSLQVDFGLREPAKASTPDTLAFWLRGDWSVGFSRSRARSWPENRLKPRLQQTGKKFQGYERVHSSKSVAVIINFKEAK
jgi:hypothetical protein